jgi:hypothetical protein
MRRKLCSLLVTVSMSLHIVENSWEDLSRDFRFAFLTFIEYTRNGFDRAISKILSIPSDLMADEGPTGSAARAIPSPEVSDFRRLFQLFRHVIRRCPSLFQRFSSVYTNSKHRSSQIE